MVLVSPIALKLSLVKLFFYGPIHVPHPEYRSNPKKFRKYPQYVSAKIFFPDRFPLYYKGLGHGIVIAQ